MIIEYIPFMLFSIGVFLYTIYLFLIVKFYRRDNRGYGISQRKKHTLLHLYNSSGMFIFVSFILYIQNHISNASIKLNELHAEAIPTLQTTNNLMNDLRLTTSTVNNALLRTNFTNILKELSTNLNIMNRMSGSVPQLRELYNESRNANNYLLEDPAAHQQPPPSTTQHASNFNTGN